MRCTSARRSVIVGAASADGAVGAGDAVVVVVEALAVVVVDCGAGVAEPQAVSAKVARSAEVIRSITFYLCRHERGGATFRRNLLTQLLAIGSAKRGFVRCINRDFDFVGRARSVDQDDAIAG